MSAIALASTATGGVLVLRNFEACSRWLGMGLLGFGLWNLVTPAWADQNIIAKDNMQVDCMLSQSDLTRISLKDDKFASVSKISTGNPADELTIINEPRRGDIYLSVPAGFKRPLVSFFTTTERGYVYKFQCRIGGPSAEQVFITNQALEQVATADAVPAAALGPRESSAALVSAMHNQQALSGYEVRQDNLEPVKVGSLQVRMIAEYRGLDLNGKQLLVENRGKTDVSIDENTFRLTSLVALSPLKPVLKPGESTTVYLVLGTGG